MPAIHEADLARLERLRPPATSVKRPSLSTWCQRQWSHADLLAGAKRAVTTRTSRPRRLRSCRTTSRYQRLNRRLRVALGAAPGRSGSRAAPAPFSPVLALTRTASSASMPMISLDLLDDPRRVGRRQVDLVQHRDDLEPLVGAPCSNWRRSAPRRPAPRPHQPARPSHAASERRDLIGEVDVPGVSIF